MNASGEAVSAAARFYKVAPADVLVVHDELDLPFGRLQLKRGGGTGGHNGLQSILVEQLGTTASPGCASASASRRGPTPRSGWWATCSPTSPPRRRPPWSRSSSAGGRWPEDWVTLGLADGDEPLTTER